MQQLTLEIGEFKGPSEITVEKAPFLQPSSTGLKLSDSIPAHLLDEPLLRELSNIPDRMGFKIGEVADLVGIKQYVIRYWESEFEVLKPRKANNNQRYFTKKDVENVFLIRKLLHRDRYSLDGAKAALSSLKKVVKTQKNSIKQDNHFRASYGQMELQIHDLLNGLNKLKKLFN